MSNEKQSEGRLTTHVLDTARGCPAAGIQIELFRLEDGEWVSIRTVTTNYDGRVDGALLLGTEMRIGTYRLVFHAGDYLRDNGDDLPDPAFLDVIPIRFGIADRNSHYHVPLLLSPYGYSTYRGS
ncbi:hydroxyisourate hydrolase [Pseudohoeflea coraliihabitans]|uniref:5-hydroxyisourate hydrolase n=1 Tax=Pseudohoeflea coraliihabitans TaxID=2860393 RepID=A0ABS6WM22_9HYPH|nr:hydroxyisourate hydrolase [Pseudohoeflea sp. DP4N28-3]MBW3096999.1 hydroxyisourate hydrolase [Pseudohoeflea sp. DP4N28-3]